MVSGFRKKRINSADKVGEILRTVREEKRRTLAQVAAAIHVREENLHRLEEGYYQDLPADVYVRGFLRSYAEYLNLNVSKILRLYNKERGIQDHLAHKQTAGMNQPKKIHSPLLIPRLIKTAVIVAIVLIAVLYLVWQFQNFSRNPALVIEEPADDITVHEEKVTFSGRADQESVLMINGQEVFVNEEGLFEEQIYLQSGLNTITIVARDRRGRESALTRQILYILDETGSDGQTVSFRLN